jgi:hypothetical protein
MLANFSTYFQKILILAKSFFEALLPFLIRIHRIKRLVGFRDSRPKEGNAGRRPSPAGDDMLVENPYAKTYGQFSVISTNYP